MARGHLDNDTQTFGRLPPNLIVLSAQGKCILAHCQVLMGGSQKIDSILSEWIQKRTDHPVLELDEYDFDLVNSVINFFYTHDLIVEHSAYTSDLERLVQYFDCPILTKRFGLVKKMYEKFKLFQYGEENVYSRKGPRSRVRHRGDFCIGSENGDNSSFLGSKWGDEEDGIRSRLSNISTTSSFYNPLLNVNSNVPMGGSKNFGQGGNPFARM